MASSSHLQHLTKKNPCIFSKRTLFAGVTVGAFYEPKKVCVSHFSGLRTGNLGLLWTFRVDLRLRIWETTTSKPNLNHNIEKKAILYSTLLFFLQRLQV